MILARRTWTLSSCSALLAEVVSAGGVAAPGLVSGIIASPGDEACCG